MSRQRRKTPVEKRRELEEQNSNSSGSSYVILSIFTGVAAVLSICVIFVDNNEVDLGMQLFFLVMALIMGVSSFMFKRIAEDEFAREKRLEEEHAKEFSETNNYWKTMKALKREDTMRKAKANYESSSRTEYSNLSDFEKEWLNED